MTEHETAPPPSADGTAACPFGAGAARLDDPLLFTDLGFRDRWDEMLGEDELRWTQADEQHGFWSVVRYRQIDEVFRDPVSFTSESGTMLNLLGNDDPAAGRQIAATDPPQHTVLRARLQKAMAIKAVERQHEMISGLVREILAPLRDDGGIDFAQAMLELPVAVGATSMGLPRSDWPWLTRLLNAAAAPTDPLFATSEDPREVLQNAHRELFAYFTDVYAERRPNRSTDLVSVLIDTEVGERTMNPAEVISNCYSVLLGAAVTTPHAPGHVLAEHLEDGVVDRWSADLEATPTAVEEALRMGSPVNYFMRSATRDCQVGSTRISAGDAVVCWLGAANRDPGVFPDPHTFDVRRRPNKHLAFGIGPHYCVGHTVARVTLRILFDELFGGFDDIALAGTPVRMASTFLSGYTQMPITAVPRRLDDRTT